MRACGAWLRHQHTAEENLTGAVKKTMSFCALCSSAAVAVAIGQLQLQLSHYSYSLTGFLLPEM